jgi:hypothetical protein
MLVEAAESKLENPRERKLWGNKPERRVTAFWFTAHLLPYTLRIPLRYPICIIVAYQILEIRCTAMTYLVINNTRLHSIPT